MFQHDIQRACFFLASKHIWWAYYPAGIHLWPLYPPNPNAPRTAHRPNPKLSAVSPTRLHLFLSKTSLTPRSQASSRPRSDSPPKDLHLWMRESTPKVICHHPEEAYSTETMTELARRLGKKLEEGVIPIGLKVYPLPRRKSDSHWFLLIERRQTG